MGKVAFSDVLSCMMRQWTLISGSFKLSLKQWEENIPQTIITDQDMVMKSAIEQVFINTKHKNCLFHIKTKCYNKNVKVFAANEGLYEDFEDIMNNSLTVEEFERL